MKDQRFFLQNRSVLGLIKSTRFCASTMNKSAILAGALGGIAPNVVRIAVNLTSSEPSGIFDRPIQFTIGLLLFAILGAGIVWALKEADLNRALFIGVGLPSMLQVGALQQTVNNAAVQTNLIAPPAAGTQASISFLPGAYAQPDPSPTPPPIVTGRKLNLVTDNASPKYMISFYGSDGHLLQSRPIVSSGGSQVVDVPEAATKFAIGAASCISPSYDVSKSPNAVQQVEVTFRPNVFLRTIGFANACDISAAVRDVP
jgi:hypothetical protein